LFIQYFDPVLTDRSVTLKRKERKKERKDDEIWDFIVNSIELPLHGIEDVKIIEKAKLEITSYLVVLGCYEIELKFR